jgi:hypothetical protein
MLEPLDKPAFQRITRKLAAAAIIWGLVVALAAGSGFLRSFHPLMMGPLIALLAGALALPLLRGRDGRYDYLSKNLFGFADFMVAIGTGLTLTLLHDPRMGAIRELPLALIPLFGVGITCTAHIIAFHLLWTERRAFATVRRESREHSMRLPA